MIFHYWNNRWLFCYWLPGKESLYISLLFKPSEKCWGSNTHLIHKWLFKCKSDLITLFQGACISYLLHWEYNQNFAHGPQALHALCLISLLQPTLATFLLVLHDPVQSLSSSFYKAIHILPLLDFPSPYTLYLYLDHYSHGSSYHSVLSLIARHYLLFLLE